MKKFYITLAVAAFVAAASLAASAQTTSDKDSRSKEAAAQPDIVIGSWCGKKFVPEKFSARSGFDAIPAVSDGSLHEIKSALILQPGPAALTDGLDALERIVVQWAGRPASARVA